MKTKLLLILFLVLSACTAPPKTFLPVQISQTEPSFSGNSQNSGVLDFVEGEGFILTDSAVIRYKELADKFSEKSIGLSVQNGRNVLDKEGMVLFLTLNDKNINK